MLPASLSARSSLCLKKAFKAHNKQNLMASQCMAPRSQGCALMLLELIQQSHAAEQNATSKYQHRIVIATQSTWPPCTWGRFRGVEGVEDGGLWGSSRGLRGRRGLRKPHNHSSCLQPEGLDQWIATVPYIPEAHKALQGLYQAYPANRSLNPRSPGTL